MFYIYIKNYTMRYYIRFFYYHFIIILIILSSTHTGTVRIKTNRLLNSLQRLGGCTPKTWPTNWQLAE